MTWANALTALRLLTIVPLCDAVTDADWSLAAFFFTVAALTDYFDGPLARKFGQTSVLGGFIDHATDALFVTSACTTLALSGHINTLLPFLIPVAFLQYSIDSQVFRGRALRPNPLGRWNGIAYYVLPGFVIGVHLFRIDTLLMPVASALGWLLSGSTLVSMGMRARAYFPR
jgi:phosphatidylglycerophosphate synthase